MVRDQLSLRPSDWPARSGIVPSLDGLRAISVSIVLAGHMLLPTSLLGISALGLKIFFFLSGFLITRLLLAENKATGSISLPNFYIRRVLRLYPVIVVYVLMASTVLWARGETIDPTELASVFFYFVNYLVIHRDHLGQIMVMPVGMLWSLSVEEHFYLLAPLALVLVRGNARKMLMMAAVICVLSLVLRLVYAHMQPGIVDTLELYQRSETRFDSIAFGVILACMADLQAGRRIIEWLSSRGFVIAGVLLLLVSFAIRDHYFQNTWRFTVQGLALFPIVAGVVFAQPFAFVNRVLNSALFVWVGALSYSLYVWHGSVYFLFHTTLEKLPVHVQGFADLAIALVLATFSYYVIEKPVLRLRKRFGHKASKPAEESETAAETEAVPAKA